MKKPLLALVASAATLASVSASAAIIVSMVPAAQSVAIGDTISVDIRISGLGSEILSAFDLNVLFNDSLVQGAGQGISFFGAEFGDPDTFFVASFAAGNNGAVGGSLLFDDDVVAGLQTDDSFVFLSFSWVAAADGAFVLNFGGPPDFERNVIGRDSLSLNASFQGACVAIGNGRCDNNVPEPASYGLAGLALLGCGLATKRRRRQG